MTKIKFIFVAFFIMLLAGCGSPPAPSPPVLVTFPAYLLERDSVPVPAPPLESDYEEMTDQEKKEVLGLLVRNLFTVIGLRDKQIQAIRNYQEELIKRYSGDKNVIISKEL